MCYLCTEMFSSESYLMQKENEIYQLKYDMFMTFERDKGKQIDSKYHQFT